MTALYHPRPERWPQVSLKGFFVLVAVLGAGLGWLGVQMKWIRDRHAILADDSVAAFTERIVPPADGGMVTREISLGIPWADAPWSLRLFGEDGYAFILIMRPMSNSEIDRIRRLFPEAKISSRYEA